MNFVGSGKLLTNADYVSVANAMGVAVATIQGVIDVEAAGHGFDYSSRPKILTEPHVFYRLLGEGAKRNQAVASGIAYEHWGMKPYPKTSDGNYVRLQQMMAIDEDCALRATSWGLTQIMGDNYAECEYNTVLEMVEDYMTGEAAQLVAFQHLLENWHLIPALKKRNAAAFAARYNGPGFKKNGYDTKLIHAWRIRDRGHVQGFMDSVPTEVRVPDPTTPLVAGDDTGGLHVEHVGAAVADDVIDTQSPLILSHIQKRLTDLGYFEVGSIDGGVSGVARTMGAINAFRMDNGLPIADVDGTPLGVDNDLLVALLTASPRKVPPERQGATTDSLRPNSTILQATWRQKITASFTALGGAIYTASQGLLDNFPAAKEKLVPLHEFFASVPTWLWGLIVVSVSLSIWAGARKIEARRVDMFKTGEVT